jgi:hypothetical protein
MFHVEKMVPDDFGFAVGLTDTVNWGFVEEDFGFMQRLEPEGCFILYDDDARIGISTTISYGRIGWFGNLIIAEQCRNKGAGSFLVRHSLEYLSAKETCTVGLYAYVDKIPFYEALSFIKGIDYEVMRAKKLFPSELFRNADVQEASKSDLSELVAFDQRYFGGSREKLLKAIMAVPSNICYLSYGKNRLKGYVMAKVYGGVAEIGPLVCERTRDNIELCLLQAIFREIEGFDVSLCALKKGEVLSFIQKCGFVNDFPVVRMFFNPMIGNDCITLAESLERG